MHSTTHTPAGHHYLRLFARGWLAVQTHTCGALAWTVYSILGNMSTENYSKWRLVYLLSLERCVVVSGWPTGQHMQPVKNFSVVFLYIFTQYMTWPNLSISAAAIFNLQSISKVSPYVAAGVNEPSASTRCSHVIPHVSVCVFFLSRATYFQAKIAADERWLSYFLIRVLACRPGPC